MPEHRRHAFAMLLRLSSDEAETLHATAREMGLTASSLLRLMIRNARFLAVSVPPIEAVVDGEAVDNQAQ